jgi:hypothetical protein
VSGGLHSGQLGTGPPLGHPLAVLKPPLTLCSSSRERLRRVSWFKTSFLGLFSILVLLRGWRAWTGWPLVLRWIALNATQWLRSRRTGTGAVRRCGTANNLLQFTDGKVSESFLIQCQFFHYYGPSWMGLAITELRMTVLFHRWRRALRTGKPGFANGYLCEESAFHTP